MITGFDHVVIAVRDIAQGVAAYETLLGRIADSRGQHDGVATALIVADNIAVELMAPEGDSDGARRVRAALEGGEGLKSLVFGVKDVAQMHRRAERVGLAPGELSEREGWTSFRADTLRTHGVRQFFLQRRAPLSARRMPKDTIQSLDHVVVRSADLERAAALYGARLGLDMRLDRDVAGRRMMFFRCGDAVVEVVHDTSVTDDVLWGLSWRVGDIEAAHARLAGGFDVSEVRPGMKPGTRVFTVRSGTCGVPTLILGAAGA